MFSYWTKGSLKTLYTVFVRPHLEYPNSVWCPYLKQDIRAIERVQRRATKMVLELKYPNYTERLKQLGLTTLEARRQRGDLIQYFRFANNINHISWYHPNSLNESGPASSTRGQNAKNYPARSNFFTNRIVNLWNALPPEVISAQSVNSFKNRYDGHLENLEKTMAVESFPTNEPVPTNFLNVENSCCWSSTLVGESNWRVWLVRQGDSIYSSCL